MELVIVGLNKSASGAKSDPSFAVLVVLPRNAPGKRTNLLDAQESRGNARGKPKF